MYNVQSAMYKANQPLTPPLREGDKGRSENYELKICILQKKVVNLQPN